MKSQQKILSICIPTYNRENALERTLSTLEREITSVKDDIEICISDNGSSDGTQAVIAKWTKRLPISSSRNEENFGFDINVVRVAKLAEGKFIWFIGDDDVMVEGSVKRIVNGIKTNSDKDIGVIFVNQLLHNNIITHFGFTDFRVFNKNEFNFPLNISFEGSICVNTILVKKVIAQTSEKDHKLYKSGFDEPILQGFAHSYLFLECMKQGAYIGIEPVYGMQFMALGEKTTYNKKILYEMFMAKYYLEIRKYYPWFNDSKIYNVSGYWKKLLSNGAVACERPELEYAYKMLYEMYLRILANQHRTLEIWASKGFEFFRRTPLGRIFLVPLHHYVRKRQGLELDPKPNTVKDLDENLTLMVARVEKMLAED